jgi:uncharacterized membrane protein YbhN (UPF0104 family)
VIAAIAGTDWLWIVVAFLAGAVAVVVVDRIR